MIDTREAIAVLTAAYADAIFVSTCGFISRDLLASGDRSSYFYLVGSMGMAGPIGLGLALAEPQRQVIVLDGDGSFAMNLGVLPVLASHAPNLVHVVLDNRSHASTGGQRTIEIQDHVGVALAAGYSAAQSVAELAELEANLPGPGALGFLHVECAPRDYVIGARLELTPQQLVARFRRYLQTGEAVLK